MNHHPIPAAARWLSLLLLAIPVLPAEDLSDGKRRIMLELLVLMKSKEKFELGQLEGFKMGFNMNPATATIPKARKDKIYQIAEEVFTKEMPWNEYQEKLVIEMGKIYSQEQLLKLTDLFKSEAGRILVEGELRLVGPTMVIASEYGKRLIPTLVERLKAIDEKEGPSDPP